MKPRFVAVLDGNGAYFVGDNESTKWNMPTKAVTLFLRRNAAEKIAEILNNEWNAFQANPT